jgi:hypothetical protein
MEELSHFSLRAILGRIRACREWRERTAKLDTEVMARGYSLQTKDAG